MNESREESGTVVEVTTTTPSREPECGFVEVVSTSGHLDGKLGRTHSDRYSQQLKATKQVKILRAYLFLTRTHLSIFVEACDSVNPVCW